VDGAGGRIKMAMIAEQQRLFGAEARSPHYR
jgi:hypothetical protein